MSVTCELVLHCCTTPPEKGSRDPVVIDCDAPHEADMPPPPAGCSWRLSRIAHYGHMVRLIFRAVGART